MSTTHSTTHPTTHSGNIGYFPLLGNSRFRIACLNACQVDTICSPTDLQAAACVLFGKCFTEAAAHEQVISGSRACTKKKKKKKKNKKTKTACHTRTGSSALDYFSICCTVHAIPVMNSSILTATKSAHVLRFGGHLHLLRKPCSSSATQSLLPNEIVVAGMTVQCTSIPLHHWDATMFCSVFCVATSLPSTCLFTVQGQK